MSLRDFFVQVAGNIWFDNSTNGFIADEVQSAIEEAKAAAAASSSPGFTWGRSGNIPSGTWLLNDSVPSNKAGRTIVLTSAKIVRVFTASEQLDTYTLGIYSHDGNEINLTLVTTLVVTASRSGNSGTITIPVTTDKQLATKLETGSAKNLIVGVIMQGNV